jgi:hypothetical protein
MKRFDLLDEFSTVMTPNVTLEPRVKQRTKATRHGLSVRKASLIVLIAALAFGWLV